MQMLTGTVKPVYSDHLWAKLIMVSKERWSLKVKIHDRDHLGTYPSGLYREVVLLQGGIFRQVSLQ